MSDTYQINSVEEITVGKVRTVRVIGADEFAVMANGRQIQMHVPLCSGCDEHVYAGDACSCGIAWSEDDAGNLVGEEA
ncbi:MAG TPA: hypothetical protein VIG66_09910 [Noviherbaspirillum sp.]